MVSSGKTQREIVQGVSTSETSIMNWKRGQIPKGEELHRLSKFFGVTMEWFLTGDEDSAPKSADGWQQRAIAAEAKVEMLKAGMQGLLKKI